MTKVDTFIAIEILVGTYAQIASRSSKSSKGINMVGGICDAGYNGNIIVQLHNNTLQDHIVQRHNKIAQLILLALVNIQKLERVTKREEIPASERQ